MSTTIRRWLPLTLAWLAACASEPDKATPAGASDGASDGGASDGGASDGGADGADGGAGEGAADGGDSGGEAPVVPARVGETVVAYLPGITLSSVITLGDGSFLAAGRAGALEAGGFTELSAPEVPGAPGGAVRGVLVHLSPDLREQRAVYALPAGACDGLVRLRQTGPHGDIFISGLTRADKAADTGAFIARLDGNGTTRPITGLSTLSSYWVEGDAQTLQPWDVDAEGYVTYAAGQAYGYDWAAVYRLDPSGARTVVPRWRRHWVHDGAGGLTERASDDVSGDDDVSHSAVIFKLNSRCALRSWTDGDYTALTDDGNGGTRQGTWPADLFFSGPCDPAAATAEGPGYTGYRLGANPTARVGSIVVDRRDGAAFIGFSVQSRLPSGLPDFEPAVVAFERDGRLRGWSRLYTESSDNSTPDQYVDHLALSEDGLLTVIARAHGNNTTNLWDGDAVAATGAARSFHTRFTGTEGNIHISWIGRLDAATLQLQAATWLAEYPDGMAGTGTAYADPNLDGWPDHDAAWPDLNTTRSSALAVDAEGRVSVAAVGRRTITTAGAFQKMLKPEAGHSSWNSFVRTYTPSLDAALYSSVLTGTWDPLTQAGGDNVELLGIVPTEDGLLAVGRAKLDDDGLPRGNPMPTAAVPSWGAASPTGADGVIAHLLRE